MNDFTKSIIEQAAAVQIGDEAAFSKLMSRIFRVMDDGECVGLLDAMKAGIQAAR